MVHQLAIIDAVTKLASVDRIGLLSPSAPYAAVFAGGKEVKRYLDGTGVYTLNIQFSGRGKDQVEVSETLCGICNGLSAIPAHRLPEGDGWKIRRIAVGTPPSPKGQSEDGTWYFACIISIEYHTRRKTK